MRLESSKRRWPWQPPKAAPDKALRLEGKLCILRAKRLEDAEQDYSWRTDPELAALDASVPLTISLNEFMRYHRDEVEVPSPWSVRMGIDALDGRHIGNCMYYDIDPERRQAEVGIMIGDRGYWGRGYGVDALRTLLRHIFTETPLDHIYLHTLVGNERAQRAFTRAGFKPVVKLRRDGYDFLKMEVWREEWERQEQAAGGQDARRNSNGAAPTQDQATQ